MSAVAPKFVEEVLTNDLFDQLALVRRSALDINGHRKTVISADLRAFAALGRANGEAPFFSLRVKDASMPPIKRQLPAGS
jgi:hypothetical protein